MFKRKSRLMVGIVLLVAATGCVDQPAAETVEPTESPATETASPEPTAAFTAEPTATPVPTSTPVPTVSPEMLAYRDTVLPLAEDIIAACGEIDHLLGDFTPDLYFDKPWLDSIGAQMMIVQDDHFVLSAMSPPDEAADIHAMIVGGSQGCDDAVGLLGEGILHLEDDKLESAASMMAACVELIGEGVGMLDEYAGEVE